MNRAFHSSIEETASLWAARLRSGPITDSARRELHAWLEENPEHRSCLESFIEESASLDGVLAQLRSEGCMMSAVTPEKPRAVLKWTLSLSSLAAAALLVFVLWPASVLNIQSEPGSPKTVLLEDGSSLVLSANSQATVRMERRSRVVELTGGEALFSVAKDASRPFWVKTAAGTVRVTGTVFDVRLKGAKEQEVTVLEGRVEVARAGAPEDSRALVVGDQAEFGAGNLLVRKLSARELEWVTTWRSGIAIFDAEPLHEALARFCNYNGKKVTLHPSIASLPVGGRYRLADLNAFLRAVEEVLPVKVQRGENGSVQIEPR